MKIYSVYFSEVTYLYYNSFLSCVYDSGVEKRCLNFPHLLHRKKSAPKCSLITFRVPESPLVTTISKTIKYIITTKQNTQLKLEGGIYSMTCNDCQKGYIGETSRRLNKRII